MKSKLLACAAATTLALYTLLNASSASAAGISQIDGGGSGGIFAMSTDGSSATTTTAAPGTTVDIPAGSLIVIMAAFRSATGILSCTDSHGGSYAAPVATQGPNSAEVRIFYLWNPQDYPTGTTFSCTFGASGAARSMVVAAFSGAAMVPSDGAQGYYSSTFPASAPYTATIGPLSYRFPDDLVVYVASGVSVSVWTSEAPGFTTLTSSASANAHFAFCGAGTACPSSPVTASPVATASASSAYGAEIAAFASAASAPRHHLRTMLGVGN